MPLYEFYCRNCHTIYNFFARRVDTETIPKCPKHGGHKLKRQMSRFAISKGRGDSPPDSDAGMPPDMDDEKMERAMMQLASEAEGMNEDDPQAMARMMRRMMDTTGMSMGEGMEEAIRRMEAGEDPDKVEEEMGGLLDGDDAFGAPGAPAKEGRFQAMKRRLTEAPDVDEEVYDM